jgi:hypothetical protein
VEIQIWGEGPAIILRDGQQFEATWVRADRHDMLTFVDDDGDPLPCRSATAGSRSCPCTTRIR